MSENEAKYEVLARKYRPRQFSEVVGQQHVTQTLTNALQRNRIAQAYLFVGPRGVGKTTIARILAKALNCEKGPTPTPCDVCDSCKQIAQGGHLDVLEIDGASNNGVDQVRDLRDSVRYAPARGPYKVYIIDEVHMLSIGAFNALLKTLEEPPPHVKFIFATTEPQKVPATILSRCQRFDLRRIATRDMVAHLTMIAKAEHVKIDEAALLAVARGAEGGLRDAESALDQLMTFCGKEITEANVLSVFGLVSWTSLEQLVEALLKGDIPRLLRLIAELDEAGKDLHRLTAEILEYLRNLMVMAHAADVLGERELADAQLVTLRKQAGLVSAGRLASVVEVLIEAQGQIRHALARRTVLEVALIRAARTATVATLDEVLSALAGVELLAGPVVAGDAPPAVSPPVVPVSPAAAAAVTPDGSGVETLRQKWAQIVERVHAASPLAKSYLADVVPSRVDGQQVTLSFDPEFADSCEKLKVPRSLRALQAALEWALGHEVILDLVVGHPPTEPIAEAPVQATKKAAPRSTKDWVKDPAVKRTLETFNGNIVDVRE
jgi:DNA polymerase-3 subunit gamma/tau